MTREAQCHIIQYGVSREKFVTLALKTDMSKTIRGAEWNKRVRKRDRNFISVAFRITHLIPLHAQTRKRRKWS